MEEKWIDRHHRELAEIFGEVIETGSAPWQQSWEPGVPFLPISFSSDEPYRRSNVSVLLRAAEEKGYRDTYWVTFLGALGAGGHVKKGEKATTIASPITKEIRDEHGRVVFDKKGKPVTEIVGWRPTWLFNVEQTEGLDLAELRKRARQALQTWKAQGRIEQMAQDIGVQITHRDGEDVAAKYHPERDLIVLPPQARFASPTNYYQTKLHELAHATGHESRLDRSTLNDHDGFDSESYAKEELCAEIATMMTGGRLGIGHEPRHGDRYVDSWVSVLEGDTQSFQEVSGEAQKISNWLMERVVLRQNLIAPNGVSAVAD